MAVPQRNIFFLNYMIFIFAEFNHEKVKGITCIKMIKRVGSDFPVWLSIQLISGGLELVLGHIEILYCIVLQSLHEHENINNKIHSCFVIPGFRLLGANKL